MEDEPVECIFARDSDKAISPIADQKSDKRDVNPIAGDVMKSQSEGREESQGESE